MMNITRKCPRCEADSPIVLARNKDAIMILGEKEYEISGSYIGDFVCPECGLRFQEYLPEELLKDVNW